MLMTKKSISHHHKWLQGSIREWLRCNWDMPYKRNIWSSVPYHKNTSIKGYRSLIFRSVHNFDLCLLLKNNSSFFFINRLLQLFINILHFWWNSGDHDMVVPFLATQAWIRYLNYSIIDDWRPWMIQNQVAGYYIYYLSFVCSI